MTGSIAHNHCVDIYGTVVFLFFILLMQKQSKPLQLQESKSLK